MCIREERMQRHREQVWIEKKSALHHLLCSGEQGQDVDSQLALVGAAFRLTLDLLNNT